MLNKRVSEKVIWEDSISPDNEASLASSPSQMHTQPQMTFCYKCNNVIPGNSKFCPYCQTELYVVCPKCGEKYSSQYPSCSQCGTNRGEYLELQKKEQERKYAIERERKRKAEIEERKRLEEERIRKEKEEELELQKRREVYKQKEAIRSELDFIKGTQEFKCAYECLLELNKSKEEYNKKRDKIVFKRLIIMAVIWVLGLMFYNELPTFIHVIILTLPLWGTFLIIAQTKAIHNIKDLQKYCPLNQKYNDKLTQEIVNRVSEYIATHRVDLENTFSKEHFDEEVIKAYKEAGGQIMAKR